MNKEIIQATEEMKANMYKATRKVDCHYVDYDFKLFGATCEYCGIKGNHAEDCVVVSAIDLIRGW